MRVVLPGGDGGVVHLFVVYAYQGPEEDSEKLSLTDQADSCCACWGSGCVCAAAFFWLVTLMLILVSSLAWLRVLLLVGS